MMVEVYTGFADALKHETLFRWHRMLLYHDRRSDHARLPGRFQVFRRAVRERCYSAATAESGAGT